MANGDGDLDDRVIDRSGDIDQRPPEERFKGIAGQQTYLPALPSGDAISARDAFSQPPSQYAPPPASPLYPTYPKPPDATVAQAAIRLQKSLDAKAAKAKSRLDSLAARIEVQEKRCVPPKLDDDLQQLRFERQKLLVANGPQLADLLRGERAALSDLETFKAANRIIRDAHYPSSPVLAVGVLLMLVLVEAGLNGVLFASSSDQGLMGGWLEALVLAITNVGVAFLLGRLLLPHLHGRNVLKRIVTGVAVAAGVALVIAVNLAGAHYRDFRAEIAEVEPLPAAAQPLPKSGAITIPGKSAPSFTGPGNAAKKPAPNLPPSPQTTAEAPAPPRTLAPAERDIIQRAIDTPFQFRSFTSFFLVVIGLCGAAIAAADGYKMDDPFPGYGRRHRRYQVSRERSAAGLKKILNQSDAIVGGAAQSVSRLIAAYGHETAALHSLHHAYAGELKAQQTELDHAVKSSDEELSHAYRLQHKVSTRNENTEYATLGTKPLPPLNEKHVRFLESHERKLKALQKSASKEQGDILLMFETASADFQTLLNEAGRASLSAARGNAVSD